jgi:hypothetical protein
LLLHHPQGPQAALKQLQVRRTLLYMQPPSWMQQRQMSAALLLLLPLPLLLLL